MAKPQPENRREPEATPTKVLPMDLRLGDRLTDESAEWEIIGRPYTMNATQMIREEAR